MGKDLALPFDLDIAEKLLNEFGSPLYVYDEQGIRETAQDLHEAFSWAKGYKNYFAVKATPTPGILKILVDAGMGLDCSTRSELLMAQKMGLAGTDIFYTSNNTPLEDFELAIDLGATINIDDLTQFPVFLKALNGRRIERVAARYNPGGLKTGNAIIGEPTEAKYGMGIDSLVQTFKLLNEQQITEFGLHTMVVSNELQSDYFVDTASLLFDAMEEVERRAGVGFSFVNLGGGLGHNYKTDEDPIDIQKVADGVKRVIKERKKKISVCTENGRYVTAQHGYLLTRVRYVMHKYKTYLGVDASMQNLMRPGMYGAYHHVTVLGKEKKNHTNTYDIVGALCENNDKFAISRELPEAIEGDILAIHDTGAHGHAMGFNYNGLLRSAEVILSPNGKARLVRRAETVEDYFRTIIW